MSPSRQLGLVQIDHELHVDPRLLEPAPHLVLVRGAMVDVLVEVTPIRAGRTPNEQERASSSQHPDGPVAVTRLAEVPRAPVGPEASVESSGR
eukprot:2460725-Alexandrium_andersonii.AAC.1